jgi:hypothetical protein
MGRKFFRLCGGAVIVDSHVLSPYNFIVRGAFVIEQNVASPFFK